MLIQAIKFIKDIIYKIFSILFTNYRRPIYSDSLYFFAKKYVNFYENVENADFDINGEKFFVFNILKRMSPAIVFDIGANKGDYSEMLINAGLKAEVHCFEPDRRVFGELQDKFRSNNQFSLNNMGLGERQGKSSFNLNEDDPGLNSVLNMNEIGYSYRNKVVEIDLDTIDNYCDSNHVDRIDFIKLDVEGFEIPVLRGGYGNV